MSGRSSAPDFLEPFVGWKGLHANRDGRLFSPQEHANFDWPAGAPFEARCIQNPDHAAPVKRCTCGIYSVISFDELRKAGYNWGASYRSDERGDCIAVVAEIKLWGKIRKGQIGYRAEYAYPGKVYVPAHKLELGRIIRDRYECGLGVIDRFSGRRT